MEKIYLKLLINSLLSVLLVQSQTQERIPQQWINQVIETKPHPIHCHKVSEDVIENNVRPPSYSYNNQGQQRPARVPQNLVALNPVNSPNPVSSGPQFARSIEPDFPAEEDLRRNNDAENFLGDEPQFDTRKKAQNTDVNISPNNGVSSIKILSSRQRPRTTQVPFTENNNPVTPTPVICVKESKVVHVATDPYRRSFDEPISGVEMANADSQPVRNTYPKPNNLISCYACSNMSNVHCNEPTNGLTTIKYCADLCIKKVVRANGLPVLLRDCGTSCESKFTKGGVHDCNVCDTDLCNGAFSFGSGPTLFNTICSLFILLGVKLV